MKTYAFRKVSLTRPHHWAHEVYRVAGGAWLMEFGLEENRFVVRTGEVRMSLADAEWISTKARELLDKDNGRYAGFSAGLQKHALREVQDGMPEI